MKLRIIKENDKYIVERKSFFFGWYNCIEISVTVFYSMVTSPCTFNTLDEAKKELQDYLDCFYKNKKEVVYNIEV